MQDFYVYMFLRKEDSEHGPAGSPYYVGKGRGDRINCKQRRVKALPEQRHKIAEDLTEDEAFSLEMELIQQYGRVDLDTGILRNLSDGGEGNSNRTMPQSWHDSHSERMLGNTIAVGHKQTEDHVIKRASATARTWTVVTPDGEEITVHNMAEFCRDHGLSKQAMTNVARGRAKTHKGYTCLKEAA